jgi:2,4-dienoyl-CoA reductase-like NADH-dependent reductase (Old Yellow Enzyme family)
MTKVGAVRGFERLLSPGRLGSLELRNRIAMAPMGVNLGEDDGTVGDRQAAWFEARARGGAGLIIVGSASVAYPEASTDARQIAASDDRHQPGLQRLVDDAHRHGAAIAAQLVHNGTNSLLDIAAGRPLLVPSKKRGPAPDALSGMVTADEAAAMMAPFSSPTAAFSVREATGDDLAWVVERFVDAARRCQRAGFDGVELHAGHGYLLHAFLSPASNRRTDRWGGSPEARAELFVTVVRAVRAAVGPRYPLWARVGAFEAHRDPGQRLDDALVAMGLGIDAGLDAIHATAYGEPMVATGITDGHTPHRPGALLEHAAAVRRALGVPVIAMGRLTPEAAEQALADGAADVIAMGRPLIADPDLPAKLAAGRRDRVRPCAYQYRCIGSIFLNQPVTCAVNPDAGHEAAVPVAPATTPRHVVVAGGGPAGLECARRLAERGHRVELWEAAAQIGGRLALAEVVDPDLAGLLEWLVGAALDAGVVVHLGRRADEASVAAAGCDVLVWAIGARWEDGAGEGHDIDGAAAWLRGDAPWPPSPVTVHGSSKAAVSVAGRAAAQGQAVTLVPDDPVLAPELGLPGRFRLVADLTTAGVQIAPPAGHEPAPIEGAGTSVRVGRTGVAPPPALAGVAVHVIGDASGTAGLADALASAAALAARL